MNKGPHRFIFLKEQSGNGQWQFDALLLHASKNSYIAIKTAIITLILTAFYYFSNYFKRILSKFYMNSNGSYSK